MSISSYPKVLALGHKLVNGILDGEFHVEEKVDGSQISFGMLDGVTHIRSKGAVIYPENPPKMFQQAVGSIMEREDLLVDGKIYRGEYLQKPKHNTIEYASIPRGHIMLFDIQDEHGNPEEHGIVCDVADTLGFQKPNIFHNHGIYDGCDAGVYRALLDNDSVLGGSKIEGVVIKNHGKIMPDGKFMVAKVVSEEFKERHAEKWGETNPGQKDVISAIIQSLTTNARYEKAVQHVRERGKLSGEPRAR